MLFATRSSDCILARIPLAAKTLSLVHGAISERCKCAAKTGILEEKL